MNTSLRMNDHTQPNTPRRFLLSQQGMQSSNRTTRHRWLACCSRSIWYLVRYRSPLVPFNSRRSLWHSRQLLLPTTVVVGCSVVVELTAGKSYCLRCSHVATIAYDRRRFSQPMTFIFRLNDRVRTSSTEQFPPFVHPAWVASYDELQLPWLRVLFSHKNRWIKLSCCSFAAAVFTSLFRSETRFTIDTPRRQSKALRRPVYDIVCRVTRRSFVRPLTSRRHAYTSLLRSVVNEMRCDAVLVRTRSTSARFSELRQLAVRRWQQPQQHVSCYESRRRSRESSLSVSQSSVSPGNAEWLLISRRVESIKRKTGN